jgi:radical SAM superfamily enzyme YgiQ (UPF0313 family)
MRESQLKRYKKYEDSRKRPDYSGGDTTGDGKPADRTKPVHIEDLEIQPNLGVLLLELPPRYIPMMPNGVGHLHAILTRKASFDFQLIDSNIMAYHYINQNRDKFQSMMQLGMKNDDPWDNRNDVYWHAQEMLRTIWRFFETIIGKIEEANPRILGLSLNACNRTVAFNFIKELRQRMPRMKILAGGHDCTTPQFGVKLCEDFDYMVIGEAEEVIVPLIERILENDEDMELPGVIIKGSQKYRDAVRPLDLDYIGFPKYEWVDLDLYRNLDGEPMPVPITSSRGCKWGRCRFCIEGCTYRRRNPLSVADEIEYFTNRGFTTFQFNESDVNGDPENLYEICSCIIERKLDVILGGQLRIDRRSNKEFFDHLVRAGFKHVRFGIDGWTDRILKLQNKGYTMELVEKNLRAADEAGLFVTVNVIIGVPGETEDDIDEMISNIAALKECILSIGTCNTLLLMGGSEYYENFEKYHIKFRVPIHEIREKHSYVVPSKLWYSEGPYIDQEVRLKRMKRFVESLCEEGVYIEDYAWHFIRKLELY